MAVATAAVVGIAASGYQAYQGFSEAAKQKQLAADADKAAAKAMKEAKQKAETDYYEGLNVPLDAYEAEFENHPTIAKVINFHIFLNKVPLEVYKKLCLD